MTSPSKDTIYIDIDEEITGIIDKVRASEGKIVALVLPKRASVLQSIVNMKLLKRSADTAKKRLVLITTESGLLPLAGAVGLYVAKTPQSKPEIPVAPTIDDGDEETINEADSSDFSSADLATKPIGELAGLGVLADDEMETLELDNDEPTANLPGTLPAPVLAGAGLKTKKNKKLAVPNFERFRLLLVLGGLALVLLVVGLYFAVLVLPKATIAVKTNASTINVAADLTLNTAAKTLDPATGAVPAKQVQQQKTNSQQVPSTGTKNNGDKASGSVTLTNCTSDSSQVIVPAGTGVSANGLTYITQESANLEQSVFKGKNGPCQSFDGISSKVVKAVAQLGGAKYNLDSETAMTVAGYASVQAKTTSAIAGGTDNIVKIVSQADIEAAKQKLTAQDASGVKQVLRQQLEQQGLYAISNTYSAGTPTASNSAESGTPADTVTVTQVTTYTMFGVKQDDLKTLVDAAIKKQIDTSKQSILSEGLETAKFSVASSDSTTAQVNLQTTATAGPDINEADIKKQVAGKKGGEIRQVLQANPGVTDVQVKLSPFWVTAVPKKAEKITVIIAKPVTAKR